MSTFAQYGVRANATNTIYKTQNRVARLILHKPIKTNFKEMFNEFKWLPFPKRYLVFKGIHNLSSLYRSNLLTFSNHEYVS